ncbi:MAG TPA: urea amidolyase associated protein UAAP1 [Sphingobium sp.]
MMVTGNPRGAQAHARAMEGAHAEAMPTVPPQAADLPVEVKPQDLTWEETIASGGYATRQLARGSRLRLIDLYGDACASMLIFNERNRLERLNVADTIKVQWNAYLGTGKLLLSDMGRVLMSIVSDDANTHDALCGASNERSNMRRYGEGKNYGSHPNARDRFMLAVAKVGLGPKDVHPCINWFKGVRVEGDGTTTLQAGPFTPMRTLLLRAEMDVIVAIANCPHVLDTRPDYIVTPLRATAWRGPIAAQDDPIRLATPEGRRAFLNTEDYLRT